MKEKMSNAFAALQTDKQFRLKYDL